jgi:amidase
VESTGRLLEDLGHDVAIAHPDALDEHFVMVGGFSTVVSSWTAKSLRHWGEVIGRPVTEKDVEAGTWRVAQQGEAVGAAEYLAAIERLQAWSRRMARWWTEDFDLLVTPTIALPPPLLGTIKADAAGDDAARSTMFGLISFTPQFNVTGQPAMSLPLAWSDDGLPLGVQFVAANYREDLLIRLAAQIERAQPWANRRPGVWAGA